MQRQTLLTWHPVALQVMRAGRHHDRPRNTQWVWDILGIRAANRVCQFQIGINHVDPELTVTAFELILPSERGQLNVIEGSKDRLLVGDLRHRAVITAVPTHMFIGMTGPAGIRRDEPSLLGFLGGATLRNTVPAGSN